MNYNTHNTYGVPQSFSEFILFFWDSSDLPKWRRRRRWRARSCGGRGGGAVRSGGTSGHGAAWDAPRAHGAALRSFRPKLESVLTPQGRHGSASATPRGASGGCHLTPRPAASAWSGVVATTESMSASFVQSELERTLKECLALISEQFLLDEVGSPYTDLQAFSADESRAVKLGEVRVWVPRAGTKGSPIEKVVHVKFHVKVLTSQLVFAFTSARSLVPHFSLGVSRSGSSDACGVHVDLISKVPLEDASPEYTEQCYHALMAARNNVLSTLSALPNRGAQARAPAIPASRRPFRTHPQGRRPLGPPVLLT